MKSSILILLTLLSLPALSQTTTERQLYLADSLYRVGQFKEAINKFDQLINTYERDGSLSTRHYIMAVAYKTDALINTSEPKKANDFIESKTPLVEAIPNPDLRMIAQFYSVKGELARSHFSDFESAERYYKKSLAYSSQSEDTKGKYFESILQLATLYSDIAEYDSANQYFEMTLQGYKEIYGPNHFRVGGVYGQLASHELKKRNFWQSLANSKKALSISIWEVDSTLIDNNRYSTSDSLNVFYNDVFTLIEEQDILAKIHPIDAQIALLILNAFNSLGELEKAEKIAQEAIKVFDASDQPLLAANCKVTLAAIYSYQGQHKYALSIYRQVEQSYRQQGMEDNELTAVVYDNMAETFQRMNQLDSAKSYTAKSLKISETIFTPPHWRIAGMSFGMARVHQLSGSLDSANFYFDKSEKAGFLPIALIDLNRALIGLQLDNLNTAHTDAQSALKGLSGTNDTYHIDALTTLGQIAYKLNNIDSATVYFDRALNVALGSYDYTTLDEVKNFESYDDPMILFDAVYYKTDFLLKAVVESGQSQFLPELIALSDFGSRLIANLRATFIVEDDNVNFSKYTDRFMNICIEASIEMYKDTQDKKYIFQAFEYSDNSKSQVLLRAIKSSVLGKQENNSLLHSWAQLKKSIKSEETRIADILKTKPDNKAEIQASEKRLANLQSAYDILLDDISENHPGIFYYIADGLGQFPLQKFQRYLTKSNSTVVQYYLGQNKIYRFNLDGKDINYSIKTLNDSVLNTIQSLSSFVARNETPRQQSYQTFINDALYLKEVLLDFSVSNDQIENLIVIPHDRLSKVPFEVLLTETPNSDKIDFKSLPYLIKSINISYASSASILFETTLNNKNNFAASTAIGWAPFSDELSLSQSQEDVLRNNQLEKLVGASQELQPISEQFGGEVYLSEEASEANFKKLAGNTRILHIATHGIVDSESPEQSYLVFSQNNKDSLNDGLLHLYELYDMPLNSDLTILSACGSGDGNLTTGEGTMSLARGFTYAGSKSVVMSLWLANDNSTSKIIDGFYKHLSENDTKSEALRKSKLEYLERSNNLSSHPFYWAHLVSTGSNNPIVMEAGYPQKWLLIIVVLLLISAWWFAKKRSAPSN